MSYAFPLSSGERSLGSIIITISSGRFFHDLYVLNMHYLLPCSKKRSLDPQIRLAFPWMLWHIWENRNLSCFEQKEGIPLSTLWLVLKMKPLYGYGCISLSPRAVLRLCLKKKPHKDGPNPLLILSNVMLDRFGLETMIIKRCSLDLKRLIQKIIVS